MRPSRQPASASRAIPGVGGPIDRERLEQAPAQRVVDRPAVVGIDEAEVPELAALVDVGHAGRSEADERLREAVERAVPGDRLPQLAQIGDRVTAEGLDRAAWRSARARPRTPRRDRSSSCGASPRARPSPCSRGCARRTRAPRLASSGQAPSRFWYRTSSSRRLGAMRPPTSRRVPSWCSTSSRDDRRVALREGGEHADAGARVLAVLGVVRRERRQRARPGRASGSRAGGAAPTS